MKQYCLQVFLYINFHLLKLSLISWIRLVLFFSSPEFIYLFSSFYFTYQSQFPLPLLLSLPPSTFPSYPLPLQVSTQMGQVLPWESTKQGTPSWGRSSSSPLHQDWTRHLTLGNRIQRAKPCIRDQVTQLPPMQRA